MALILGLIVANVVRPGEGLNIDPSTLDPSKVSDYASKAHETTVSGFLLEAIPDTFLSALTAGHILQALLVSILFGVALALVGDKAGKVLDLLNQLSLVMFRLVAIIMAVAPIGAFGAMAFTIGKYGVDSLANLATLVVTFYATSLLFVLVVLGAVARLAGFSIFSLIGYLKAELLLVLGTSSSESALPSLIEKMERAGCPKSIVGLVVPTGYSFNLDGTNIYMTLAALFIAQAVGIELSLGDQLLLLGVAMLSSKGAAGITGAGFITLAATLSIVPSVPVAGMALILGIDRFMSECRSLTNFIGNAVATVVVTRWEGALDKEQFDLALAGKLPSVDRIDPGKSPPNRAQSTFRRTVGFDHRVEPADLFLLPDQPALESGSERGAGNGGKLSKTTTGPCIFPSQWPSPVARPPNAALRNFCASANKNLETRPGSIR